MGLEENPKRSAMTDCAIAAIRAICTFELIEAQRCFTLEPRDEDGKALKIGKEEFFYKLFFLEEDDGENKARGFVQAVAQICGQPFISMPGCFAATVFVRRDILLKQYDNAAKMEMAMRENGWSSFS